MLIGITGEYRCHKMMWLLIRISMSKKKMVSDSTIIIANGIVGGWFLNPYHIKWYVIIIQENLVHIIIVIGCKCICKKKK